MGNAERAYYSEGTRGNAPMAMGLYYEWLRHQESGQDTEASRERFVRNAESWVREGSAAKTASYAPIKIEIDDKGQCTLRSAGYQEPLRDVYNPHGPKGQIWPEYRRNEPVNLRRHEIEHATFMAFEQHLSEKITSGSLKDGDTYIWVSPPPTDITNNTHLSEEEKAQELRRLGYTSFSFTFVYTVRDGTIEPVVIQNVLHPVEHVRFIQEVTCPEDLVALEPHDHTLLAKIHKVQNQALADPAALCELIDTLYQATPVHRKITAPKEAVDVADVDYVLDHVRPMLTFAFYALMHLTEADVHSPAMRGRATEAFHMWRKAHQELFEGRALPVEADALLKRLQEADEDDIKKAALIHMGKIREFPTVSEYGMVQAASRAFSGISLACADTCCGAGVGWEGLQTYETAQQLFAFTQELNAANRAIKRLHFTHDRRMTETPCPDCGKRVEFSAKEVQDKLVLQCPCHKPNSRMTDPRSILRQILASTAAPPSKALNSTA